ncbi:MAG: flippase-like domain-containing protein [Lactobacillus sp.]|jgi:uncharacterized protein (TIRG00374 family)|nr:flippase-like domain-containing protein [Lactobacillus sp.]MCH3905588.1 flippase-like domain-containing protein [Lactobacillus sp.]MCH3990853.1 flippase-like domain-containing protein [Lactobacillus sp.]MCH4068431.1 flippase-like domain-containing protein [Lactobacillus sp.]
MNKKHLYGILIVLAISLAVLYHDLKQTPVKRLLAAARGLNLAWLLFVFVVMLLSYVCEASILAVLAKRKDEPKHGPWAFFRIPLIQALFNAITPMSTGGQPAQLAAFIQMGVEGGRATSLLLMKFIIYQIVVLAAYVTAIFTGFHLVMTKFKALAVFIMIGFLIHLCSIAFLLAIMFAYRWTKKTAQSLFKLLAKFMKPERVERWQQETMEKIDTFYAEGQNLKRERKKLILATLLTVLQMLCFYSIPYFILLSFGLHVSWVQVTQMNIMIILFMAIIPLPGASGGAEFSFQTLFATFISNSSQLVLAMFLWRFITYFFGMILGMFGWSIRPRKLKA